MSDFQLAPKVPLVRPSHTPPTPPRREKAGSTGQRGFTLIELLLTISIIGILSEIALQGFIAYERRARDARAESTVRVVMTAEEAYYTDNSNYLPCADGVCQTTLDGVVMSPGVTISVTTRDGDQVFDIVGRHPSGAYEFRYSSDSGRLTSVELAS